MSRYHTLIKLTTKVNIKLMPFGLIQLNVGCTNQEKIDIEGELFENGSCLYKEFAIEVATTNDIHQYILAQQYLKNAVVINKQ